jgi:hypothetical protein
VLTHAPRQTQARLSFDVGQKQMKIHYSSVLMALLLALFGVAARSEEKKVEISRLTAVDSFPEKYRNAVRVIGAAFLADGYKVDEYYAIFPSEMFLPAKESVMQVEIASIQWRQTNA